VAELATMIGALTEINLESARGFLQSAQAEKSSQLTV
jgi:hypothetical protein